MQGSGKERREPSHIKQIVKTRNLNFARKLNELNCYLCIIIGRLKEVLRCRDLCLNSGQSFV